MASTLDSAQASAAHLRARSDVAIDTIVVDNKSNDETAAVARSKGATVVYKPVQGIAQARNTGARHAEGDVLVFVDADVFMPHTLLDAVHAAMSDPTCVGGAVDVEYRPRRMSIRVYLSAWRLLGNLHGDGPRRHSVLPQVSLRTGRGLRREGVDRRGRRLLLGSQEVRQENKSRDQAHTKSACATFLPALRKVARMEDTGLDQPPFCRVVPPPEGGLERLVLGRCPIDFKGANYQAYGRPRRRARPGSSPVFKPLSITTRPLTIT